MAKVNIDIKSIILIDKRDDGKYDIKYNDGNTEILQLTDDQAAKIETYLSDQKTVDNQPTSNVKTDEDDSDLDEALENNCLNSYSFMDVSLKDKSLQAKWVSKEELSSHLLLKWDYASFDDIENPQLLEIVRKATDSVSTDGVITFNGLTLMKIRKSRAEKIQAIPGKQSQMYINARLEKTNEMFPKNKET
jgi:hypothetical protein